MSNNTLYYHLQMTKIITKNNSSSNSGLHRAKCKKDDEFYTRLEDIEKYLCLFSSEFSNKMIYCNCDDYKTSNFYKYFSDNFFNFNLKRLICTCYQQTSCGYGIIKTSTYEKHFDLKGDGDFRSEECINILRKSDIIVTNPPFSLFRSFFDQLILYKKKFITIAHQNAIAYKNVFPFIKNNQVWFERKSGRLYTFYIPYNNSDIEKETINVCGVAWLTNINYGRVYKNVPLVKKYTSEDYPKYDNYDAIEVGKSFNIPYDYDGVMGVPISFLSIYNPNQFEIVGLAKRGAGEFDLKTKVYTKNDYPNYSNLNAGPTLWDNGKLKIVYTRLLIRKI